MRRADSKLKKSGSKKKVKAEKTSSVPKTIAAAPSAGDVTQEREFTTLQGLGEWPPARIAWAQCTAREKETDA